MKNRLIKVTAAVPQLRVGDVRYNTEQIVRMIAEHADSGVIVFPSSP